MKIFKYITISCLALAACSQEEEINGGELFNQKAVLFKIDGTQRKQATFSDRTSIAVATADVNTQKEEQFVVSLAKENTEDVSVEMEISPSEVEKYNKVYGTSFLEFPQENVEFTPTLQIKSGSITSEIGSVKMLVFDQMKDNMPYMLALSVKSVSGGVDVLNTSKTIFYTIEKIKGQIKKTVKITRQEYFALEGVKSIGNNFTLEGLIYVENFRGKGEGDVGISTFMGVEGGTLLRFGDAGVDPDHLQANGQDIGIKFKPKKWYHIALVVDGNKSTAYVNGEKIMEYGRSGNLFNDNFYIGKSYNDNRGIEARLSEIRIWDAPRTSQQIKDNMYEVDVNSSNLWAYWKMNEVKNNRIKDSSPNDINLVLKGQSGKSGEQPIVIYEEASPVKID